MATIAPSKQSNYFDFQKAQASNQFTGLWRMMSGYRLVYAGATLALAVSALAKTLTFLLLRHFTDTVLPQGQTPGSDITPFLAWIALGFVGLAAVEGGFAFLSGRWA